MKMKVKAILFHVTIISWITAGIVLYYLLSQSSYSDSPSDLSSIDLNGGIRSRNSNGNSNSNSYESISATNIPILSSAMNHRNHMNYNHNNFTTFRNHHAFNGQIYSTESSITLPQQVQTNISRKVYIDWAFDSDLLSYLNYKSLESFLACCYTETTKIEAIIIGKSTANSYKIKHLLSKQTFLKYAKKGYKIGCEVYSSPEDFFSVKIGEDNRQLVNQAIGGKYFYIEMEKCCHMQSVTKANNVKELPSLMWYYSRIALLYTQGGEYYDMTWFHQFDLSQVFSSQSATSATSAQGSKVVSYCYHSNTLEMIHQPSTSLQQLPYTKTGDITCRSSSILYFPTPQSSVLECVLKDYQDTNSELWQCIDRLSSSYIEYKEILRPYDEGLCIEQSLNECFREKKITNLLQMFSEQLIGTWKPKEFEYVHSLNSESKLVAVRNTEILSKYPLVWLGAESISGQWTKPDMSSYLYNRIADNNNKILEYSQKTMSTLTNSLVTPIHSCTHYTTDEEYPNRFKNQAKASCAVSFIIPGFMKSGTTYLYDIIRQHPQVLTALRGYGFKETGCYYSDINNQSLFSYDRMNCFPFTESQDSMIYGDGTVYYIHRKYTSAFLKRENPNIKIIISLRDPVERFKSHSRFLYQESLKRGLGNMNTIVDIGLSPGSRLDGIYQLALPAVEDMRKGNIPSPAFNEFIEATVNFNRPNKKVNMSYQRATSPIYHSLYFHSIYLWDQIHGKENVYVIEGERITTYRSAKRLERLKASNISEAIRPLSYTGFELKHTLEEEIGNIFRFLGLNPLKQIPKVFQHKTTAHHIPKEHHVNQESKEKLEKFFKPFNELLTLYLRQRKQSYP